MKVPYVRLDKPKRPVEHTEVDVLQLFEHRGVKWAIHRGLNADLSNFMEPYTVAHYASGYRIATLMENSLEAAKKAVDERMDAQTIDPMQIINSRPAINK